MIFPLRKFILSLLALSGLVLLIGLTWAWRYQGPALDTSGLPETCVRRLQGLEADAAEGRGRCDIRGWYLEQVAAIAPLDERLEKQQVGARERALCAYSLRHESRIQARAQMDSRLAVALLRLRDLLKYGNADGPDFDSLVDSERPESSYQRVIATAGMTNEAVDQNCEL